jgi:hypothetical protein
MFFSCENVGPNSAVVGGDRNGSSDQGAREARGHGALRQQLQDPKQGAALRVPAPDAKGEGRSGRHFRPQRQPPERQVAHRPGHFGEQLVLRDQQQAVRDFPQELLLPGNLDGRRLVQELRHLQQARHAVDHRTRPGQHPSHHQARRHRLVPHRAAGHVRAEECHPLQHRQRRRVQVGNRLLSWKQSQDLFSHRHFKTQSYT